MIRNVLFFLIVSIAYTLAPEFYSINHSSRFDLTKAIVLDQSIQIDRFVSNTQDWSKYENHYYTNKAPGSSFVAVLPYFFLVQLDRMQGIDPLQNDFNHLLVSDFFATTLLSVLIAVMMFLWFQKWNKNDLHSRWIVISYAFGSIGYVFSTLLWGHQTAAFFLFAAFYFIFVKKKYWASGLFLGMGVLSEYTVVLALPAVLYYLISKKEKFNHYMQFVLGGGFPFILFAWYHYSAFGGIFSLAPTFGNPVFGSDQQSSLSVFGIPSLKIFYELLFGFKRGLFIITPISMFAFFGLIKTWKSKNLDEKIFAKISIYLIGAFLIFNTSFNGWHGGWSSGPRYLAPIIPFLWMGLFNIKLNYAFKILVCIGIIHCAAIVSVNTMGRPEYNLLYEEIFPHLINLSTSKINAFGLQVSLIGLGFLMFIMPNKSKEIAE